MRCLCSLAPLRQQSRRERAGSATAGVPAALGGAVLRAALLGGGGGRRCCFSNSSGLLLLLERQRLASNRCTSIGGDGAANGNTVHCGEAAVLWKLGLGSLLYVRQCDPTIVGPNASRHIVQWWMPSFAFAVVLSLALAFEAAFDIAFQGARYPCFTSGLLILHAGCVRGNKLRNSIARKRDANTSRNELPCSAAR